VIRESPAAIAASSSTDPVLDLVVRDGPAAERPDEAQPISCWRDEHGEVFAEAFVQAGTYRLTWCDVGVATFAPGQRRVELTPADGLSSDLAVDRFRRFVQPVVLQAIGYETLHASAVLTGSGAIAFCGISGSGKSTLAFAIGQRSGVVQASDDALVLDVGDEVRAAPQPFRIRLRPASQAFFDEPGASHVAPPRQDFVPLIAVFVLLPEPTIVAPAIARVPRRSAFSTLLTHAHCFDEHDRTQTTRLVQHYLRVAERVPVFTVHYALDFSRLPSLVDTVLDQVGELDGLTAASGE
jgi:hypothetical protein